MTPEQIQALANIQLIGAGAFGAVIGWYLYYINRYRKAEVQLGDLVTVIGMIGGAAVTALFNNGALFGAYGVGLATGFFSYFFLLILMVWSSKNFDVDWFLDGRRRAPEPPIYIPTVEDRARQPTIGGAAMEGGPRVDIG